MRYWLYDKPSKRVLGPYIVARLSTLPGFGPESKVAPEGSRKKSEWKPAKELPELAALFSPPQSTKP